MSGAIKTRVLLGRLQQHQHRTVFGGSVNVAKTPKDDFFLTLFKILKNYHSITVRHFKCCLATSAWKEVVCANWVLVGYSSVFTVETFFFFFNRERLKKNRCGLGL